MWYGKTKYYTILKEPQADWKWCYSAKSLQDELQQVCVGQKIRAVYVDLYAFLERIDGRQDIVDMSYYGGPAHVFFDNVVLTLIFDAEGLLRYGMTPVWEWRIRYTKDYRPLDAFEKTYLYRVSADDIADPFEDTKVEQIRVSGTDTWPFHTWDFDEDIAEAAASKNDLPAEIKFSLNNGIDLNIYGDSLEYYGISTNLHKDNNCGLDEGSESSG